MAFSLTLQNIHDKNIKHIYSGTPTDMSYRHSKEYPNMDQLRQQRESQHLKDYVLRVSEYRHDYRCFVPRAPAFRIMPKEEVDDISERLNQPKPKHETDDIEDEQTTSRRTVTKEEMDAITERLYTTPTKVTSIRVNQTRDAGHPPLPRIEV